MGTVAPITGLMARPAAALPALEAPMFGNPSLITRIAIGKGIGLVFGLLGFVLLPVFVPEAGWLIR
jgi:hypothetical protein